MPSRRTFLLSSGLTAAMSRSATGANDRIRMGVLGTGTRGSYMATVLAPNADCEIVAMCDVYKRNLDQAAAKLEAKVETYPDYRRVLERKDIDAVFIATPDHWHGPLTIQACEAGKDVYVEKPVSNSIEVGWKMIEAAQKYKRVVQVGLQQRSWDHFQQCVKMVQDGKFGTIFHAGLHWNGHYTRPVEQPQEPPADLDWELFQGPAPHVPYTPGRQRSWRSFYDYGGGIITDQGVHIGDVVHWALNVREPRTVSASAQYVTVQRPERDQPPDSFVITWQYDRFVMSFTNAYMPIPEFDNTQGNYFFGTLGTLHVNRVSYTLRPLPQRGGQPGAPFEAVNQMFRYVGGPSDAAHVRNFLDCVKSRQKPLTDIETGFYSSLPLLLGVLAVRYGKTYTWNGKEAIAVSA